MNILLVEDEVSVSSFIQRGLEEQGHRVVPVFDGVLGLKMACQNSFDVIILDLIMPGMNGLELCDNLRRQKQVSTPVLMLTALGETDDIIAGFETGADDYLTKPFKFKELLARLQALTKRGTVRGELNNHFLRAHDLEMNLKTKEVHRDGIAIKLTAREFRLLEYLLKNKNQVVSRTQILDSVWGVAFDSGTNVIDVYINYIRKKIDHGFSSKMIKTVIGMGYVIKE